MKKNKFITIVKVLQFFFLVASIGVLLCAIKAKEWFGGDVHTERKLFVVALVLFGIFLFPLIIMKIADVDCPNCYKGKGVVIAKEQISSKFTVSEGLFTTDISQTGATYSITKECPKCHHRWTTTEKR